jgi:CubicO group peptidase (beta-lactamase class C family)
VYFKAEGSASLSDPTPLRKDAIFRMYSSTKPVTAVALLQLYEQGAFQLDEPVTRLLPELADLLVGIGAKHVAAARPITIRQLITHTSGLSYGNQAGDPVDVAYRAARLWEANDLEDFVHRVAELPLKYQPGETWNYSVGMDLAGLVVQRVTGQSFRSYLKEHIFGPLGMVDTDFLVPVGKRGRLVENHVMNLSSGLAETFAEGDPSTVPGGIFSEGCFALCNFDSVTLYSGGAGLVSTAHDYLRFAEMLRNEGELDGVRVLGAKTVRYMTRNHYGSEIAPGVGFGLGFPIVVDPVANGAIGSSGAYYHDGAAGTILFIDPADELVILGFTQVLMQLDWGKNLRVAVYQAIDRPAGDS